MDDYQQIAALIDRGMPRNALVYLQSRGSGNADEGRMRCLTGRAYFAIRNFRKAKIEYESASSVGDLSLRDQTQLAVCYLRTQQRWMTSRLLTKLAPRSGEMCLVALQTTVKTALQIKHVPAIREAGQQGRRRFPDNALFWYAAGELARLLNKSPEAAEFFFKRALELEPSNHSYRIAVCQTQLLMNDIGAARSTLDFDLTSVRCLANLQRFQLLYESMDDTDGYFACFVQLMREYDRITSERYE